MEQDKIIDRIKKLMRLAESSNANEAANAAGQAQRLMEEHRIDQAVLDLGDEEPEGDDEPIVDHGNAPLTVSGRMPQWKVSLSVALASANACRCYVGWKWDSAKHAHKRTLCLVGRPSDVATVSYLFGYLSKEIDRLTRLNARGRGRTWANSYRLGAVAAIRKRLREANKEARDNARKRLEGQTTALVKMDQALARLDARASAVDEWLKKNMDLRSRSASKANRDWSAYAQGQRDGQNINLDGGGNRLGSGKKAIGDGN